MVGTVAASTIIGFVETPAVSQELVVVTTHTISLISLQVTVGGGGSAGAYGSEVGVPGGFDDFGKAVFDMVDQHG